MSLIVVIEDDPTILRGLKENLETQSHGVLTANDGPSGRQLVLEQNPDLVILDVMLPEMDGLEVCQKLRAEGFSRPILMLTARTSESDRVQGLDLGADDYVAKPFSLRELLARVRALLRRGESVVSPPAEIRFDDVLVNFRSFEVTRHGEPLSLTRKEFAILKALAERPGEAVSRNDLLAEVWGYEKYPTTRTVDTHIASLRAKLEGNASSPQRLITVHGVGYKLKL